MLIVESKRDEKLLAWLIVQVGEKAVADTIHKLAGDRHACPSSVAKVLGLQPPPALAIASDHDARRHMKAIAVQLDLRRVGGGSNGEP